MDQSLQKAPDKKIKNKKNQKKKSQGVRLGEHGSHFKMKPIFSETLYTHINKLTSCKLKKLGCLIAYQTL